MDYKKAKKIIDLIRRFQPKILVLGDIMLDNYINGAVNRISPEAPVPILNYQNETIMLGGAGNVLHNLNNLGVLPDIAAILGNDLNGEKILNLIDDLKISTDFIYSSKKMVTTKKTRFINNGTQLLRLDNDSKELFGFPFNFLENKILKTLHSYDYIVISDYNKGVCSKSVIKAIIEKSNNLNIPVLIDPKGTSWDKYLNATGITPNKKEVEEKFNTTLKTNEDFEKISRKIINKYNLKFCLITRGSDGMTYYEKNKVIHQQVGEKEVFDVSGAGDTVISSLAASICIGLDIESSIALCSYISSEVVTYAGTTPFEVEMLTKYEN
jgi:D-beta-D-heptose 7-phosphate kinase / D-beta-D-heptose 1-phosphate adenosyltransferase